MEAEIRSAEEKLYWVMDDTSCFLDPEDMPQVPPEVEERLHAEAIAILDSMLEESKERSIA